MKHLISFIFLFFLFFHLIYAQIPVLPPVPPLPRNTSNLLTVDSGNIRVLYAFNATDINKPDTYDDLHRLEIGKSASKYYSFFIYNSDSLVTDWVKKNPNNQTIPIRLGEKGKDHWWSEYYYSEFFKDFSKNILTEYARMPYGSIPNSFCEESLPVQEWKINTDTLSIAEYLCQKATCNFRGRDFTAWFTMDIPISNGPWKFGGLPGMILKVYDKEELYTFECIGIEYFEKKIPIKRYDYKRYRKIDGKRLIKLQKNIHENYLKVTGIVFENINSHDIKKKPYSPLELE